MFRCTDQIKVFAFNFVHHSFHFWEGHNAFNNVAMHKEWRDNVCEAFANHKVTCVSQNSFVQTCNVTQQVVETRTCNTTSGFKVNTAQAVKNVSVVWDFPFWNNWFTKVLNINVV